MNFLLIVFVVFFINNSIYKILSVNNLCEKNGKIRSNFAEIFGKKWGNQNETDQNTNYHQSDQNELNLANLIGTKQNCQQLSHQQKLEIIHKFHAIKERIKKRRKYSTKVWTKIERKIAGKLGIKRKEIYKWKKEIGFVYENIFYKQKKQKFIKRIDEFKRMSKNGKQKQFAEELGINERTFIKWKKEFGIEIGNKYANRYSNEEKTDKINIYYKLKNESPSLTDKKIAGLLKIGNDTLRKWKKQKKNT